MFDDQDENHSNGSESQSPRHKPSRGDWKGLGNCDLIKHDHGIHMPRLTVKSGQKYDLCFTCS